ncbi:MAG: hypothetical protein AB7S96_03325 [Candidatus Izemoplasmatales bacterium]|jgi:hypothetical protein
MKKLLIVILMTTILLLTGCRADMNNDLTDLESAFNELRENDEWIYTWPNKQEVIHDYLANYESFFTENTIYEGYIQRYSNYLDDENQRLLDIVFFISNIEEEQLTKETVDNYIYIYEQIVKDFKSLIGEDYLVLSLTFRLSDTSYVNINKMDNPDGLTYVSVFQKINDEVTITDIEEGFMVWEKLFEIDSLNRAFISFGESELYYFSILLNYDDLTFFSNAAKFSFSEEEVEEIILDYKKGFSPME